jgi:hypothetical protein
MTLCPATVTAAARDDVLVFAATETCTVASPLPELGLIDIQSTGEATLQLQRVWVRMSIDRSPPVEGADVPGAPTE